MPTIGRQLVGCDIHVLNSATCVNSKSKDCSTFNGVGQRICQEIVSLKTWAVDNFKNMLQCFVARTTMADLKWGGLSEYTSKSKPYQNYEQKFN
jgi:hypothetical protein